MQLTIIIPIIRFNHYSTIMMKNLARMEEKYESLIFLFAVSDEKVATELKILLGDFVNEYTISVLNSYSSNTLRGYAKYANTDYVYFHDCDDYADYTYLNDFCRNMSASEDVLCFNVHKYEYNEEGDIVKEYDIFHNRDGKIDCICNIPTCVYSKIIPIKYIKEIDFPNLPYTQDWSITYQLFLLAPHRFINHSSYFYNNYPTSSSQSRYDTVHRVTRVMSYGRTIIRKMKRNGRLFEADFLCARYNDAVFDRFLRIGVLINPYVPSLRLLLSATNRVRLSLLYNFFKKIASAVKYILKKR